MKARTLPNDVYLTIKAATRNLAKLCGGVEAAATETRIEKTGVGDYGNINKMGSFAPVDVIADLEMAAGEPVVTRALAKIAGYALVPTADAEGVRGVVCEIAAHQPVLLAAEIAVLLGKLQEDSLQAAADGDLSNGELDEQIRDYDLVLMQGHRNQDALRRLREARRNGSITGKESPLSTLTPATGGLRGAR